MKIRSFLAVLIFAFMGTGPLVLWGQALQAREQAPRSVGTGPGGSVGTGPGSAYEVVRVFRPERYERGDTNVRPVQAIDSASWVWMPGRDVWGSFTETRTDPAALAKVPQTFLRFRRDFEVATDAPLTFDVSADERFVLLLDGAELARGPQRGLKNRWHYQSYRVTGLTKGVHRLEAVVWQIGEHAPLAQVSVRGGFILKAEAPYDAELTTGRAVWRVAELRNTRMTDKGDSEAFGVGSQCQVTGTSFLDEEPTTWADAAVVRGPVAYFGGLVTPGWLLFPSPLRDLTHDRKTPGQVRRGPDVLRPGCVVPAQSEATVFWHLGNYYCAYPYLRVSGGKGTEIRWDWAECLTDAKGNKGDRAACEGLDIARPFGDVFLCDGRANARFTTPWWRAGTWCRLTFRTADEPLTVEGVEIAEVRYPAELKAAFASDDPFLDGLQSICARSLQMCQHDMFFDCPYYEQQMYPGDTRIQGLVSGFFDTEDRLVRNALTLFDADRRENGRISMNCPTRGTQDALGFTCVEIMMFGDYARNHTNRAWLKARMPGVNHSLLGLDASADETGLLRRTPGWNFVDWVPGWVDPGVDAGMPPGANGDRPNAEINLQYLHAMRAASEAEAAVGDAPLADYWRMRAARLSAAIKRQFWCEDRALFASDAAKTSFSEHAQCLALLADVVTGEEAERCFKALVETPGLAWCTIYFRHYLFSTYFKFRRPDLFFGSLGFWKDCLDWNLSTVLEMPGTNARSDCHGWGSHPLWHLHTGVAGVRSAAPFYGRVTVEPQPAHLTFIRSRTPVPQGAVVQDLRFDGQGGVTGTVRLPDGLAGDFRWREQTLPLKAGENVVALSVGRHTPPSAAPTRTCLFTPTGGAPRDLVIADWSATVNGEPHALVTGEHRCGFHRFRDGWTFPGFDPKKRNEVVMTGAFEVPSDGEVAAGLTGDWFYDLALDGKTVFTTGSGGNATGEYGYWNKTAKFPVTAGRHVLTATLRNGAGGLMFALGKPTARPVVAKEPVSVDDALAAARRIWAGDVYARNDARRRADMAIVQRAIDMTSGDDFGKAVGGDRSAALFKKAPALAVIDAAVDKILAEVPATKVAKGTVAVWYYYDMGHVVKTPGGTVFGIDLSGPRDAELADLLDFALVTHNHGDHASERVLRAMQRKGGFTNGKPVVSSFMYSPWHARTPKTYTFGDCTVETGVTDHNAYWTESMTPYKVTCGREPEAVTLLHAGDGWDGAQLARFAPVDMAICHVWPFDGHNAEKTAAVLKPGLLVISHAQEISHGFGPGRWDWAACEEEAARATDAGTVIYPVWGEKFVWCKRSP